MGPPATVKQCYNIAAKSDGKYQLAFGTGTDNAGCAAKQMGAVYTADRTAVRRVNLKSSFGYRSCFFAVPAEYRCFVCSQFIYKKCFCLFLRRNMDTALSFANMVDCLIILFSCCAYVYMSSTKDEFLKGFLRWGLKPSFLPLFWGFSWYGETTG